MELRIKIVLINVAIALVLSILIGGGNIFSPDFFIFLGIVFLVIGIICLFAGLILFIMEDQRYAQGFLLSSGILLLLGFMVCGGTGILM